MEIKLRVSDDIRAEAERGRIAQHFHTLQDYITALILAGSGRVSGLSEPGVFESTATDARLGGAITNAISAIERGDSAKAIAQLRFAQDVIIQSLVKKKPSADKAVDERLRILGGGDDWSEKPADKR